MGPLYDIQTALKLLRNREILEFIFRTILGLAESFKSMDRSDSTVTLFECLFLGKYERCALKILRPS